MMTSLTRKVAALLHGHLRQGATTGILLMNYWSVQLGAHVCMRAPIQLAQTVTRAMKRQILMLGWQAIPLANSVELGFSSAHSPMVSCRHSTELPF